MIIELQDWEGNVEKVVDEPRSWLEDRWRRQDEDPDGWLEYTPPTVYEECERVSWEQSDPLEEVPEKVMFTIRRYHRYELRVLRSYLTKGQMGFLERVILDSVWVYRREKPDESH